METYRSGHNESDSKSLCRLKAARGFESLRLRSKEGLPHQLKCGSPFLSSQVTKQRILFPCQADIRNPLRYLLITSLPLRGISVGACAPTEIGKSDPRFKKRGTSLMRLNKENKFIKTNQMGRICQKVSKRDDLENSFLFCGNVIC